MKDVPTPGRSPVGNIRWPIRNSLPQLAGRTGCRVSGRVSEGRVHKEAATLVPCGMASKSSFLFSGFSSCSIKRTHWMQNMPALRTFSPHLPSLPCKTSDLIICLRCLGLSDSGCSTYGQPHLSLIYGSHSGPCFCTAAHTLALPGPLGCCMVG